MKESCGLALKMPGFFYNEDRKRSLSDIVETLKDVLFQAKLGTSYEKMERFRSLAASIAEKLRPEIVEDVKRCASLCKADLVTEMVGEFPSLQGTMGSVYAAPFRRKPKCCARE